MKLTKKATTELRGGVVLLYPKTGELYTVIQTFKPTKCLECRGTGKGPRRVTVSPHNSPATRHTYTADQVQALFEKGGKITKPRSRPAKPPRLNKLRGVLTRETEL